ncbi:MAG: 3-hydroxyacyl-CoA dehydrogenase family protein [Myxococcota bacterium]|nr:3-hydroxyacyl-CoA dehydrogenase family protein [Myxococcota bacterium]
MSIETITVIGTGTMGNGIAGQAALSGYNVNLFDICEDKLKAAFDLIEKTYAKGVSKGKISANAVDAAQGRLSGKNCLEEALRTADLVIEAVPENMALKIELFRSFETYGRPGLIMASNTSSLSITEIAASVSRPEAVVGMHFFNPVAIMPLVELVRGEYTTDETLKTVRAVAEQMKKECIEVNDSPGFATSRLGIALGNEAMRMFEEGVASAADIDKAMALGYRHPIGPLALTDLVGLDVRLAISEHLYREIGSDTFRPPRILRKMVRAGKLGRKVGRGFYDYS